MGYNDEDVFFDESTGRGLMISPPISPVVSEKMRDLVTDVGRALGGSAETALARELRVAKARANRANAAATKIEARLMGMRRLRDAIPNDPCENDDLLVIERTFENGAGIATGPYKYVALRVNGRYYVTGSGMSDRYTWPQLVEWLGGDVVSITRMRGRTVEKSGKKLL